ncbi:hypothetical protein XMM379_002515 [Aliiroseovarius sp. xm-m-379]|uniref:hypothetical protein n=1 Tax=unclassified Aliiroseovarius TaxID=2623558 RepID=UPI001568E0F8|nr:MULTISPECIES: hypothetical protein [unclassified Aliiroseovarius]NRP11576.1 hypothetical protein [Aliiroseovarius sp. xm-d-517]NRP25811.1 hypothetical protein [Aliiroseovarius sp. xm-m-379]NRP31317.1 hypothetical protein [Aliiroseovarius sp. xm-m-314]NRP34610.1 hypothetical protein [Aliiroseovarius sp. xm-a-104]NRP42044.1 hypothetical protein [Aliiroseovarius sp. xm-m-339-2]
MTKLLEASKGIGGVRLGASWKKPFFIDCYKGFRTITYYPDDIETIMELDEENYRSAGGAAAFAIAGGVLTGGLGLIAGAAVGGRRRKNVVFAAKFKDGNFVVFQEKKGAGLKALQSYLFRQKIENA